MSEGRVIHTEHPPATAIFLTLFVACYNEEANICATLDTCLAALRQFEFTWEILVIDDASRDNSSRLVEKYIRDHPGVPITLIVNCENKGLAQNYIEGAFRGRGTWYRLICGDNVEPADTLVTVFRHIGDADMIIPYQVECRGKPLFRRVLSRMYTRLVNFISGYRIRYYNGLAVHSRYNVMRWHTNYRGFGFQADMIVRLLEEGMNYKEISVIAHERTAGKSTALKIKNVLSVLHTLLDLSIRRVGRLIYPPMQSVKKTS